MLIFNKLRLLRLLHLRRRRVSFFVAWLAHCDLISQILDTTRGEGKGHQRSSKKELVSWPGQSVEELCIY